MDKEILELIRKNQPQIPPERAEEILDDMKPAILKGIEFAFRAWNEGIEKRSVDERFAKGAWKDYVTNCTTECLDHMANHLINVLNNNHDEEHLAHLISRCFMISHVGLYPEYKGLPRSIVLDGAEEKENLNEVEGDACPETSHDGE